MKSFSVLVLLILFTQSSLSSAAADSTGRTNSDSLYIAGIQEYSQARYENAIRILSSDMSESLKAPAFFYLGLSYAALNDVQHARQSFRDAISIDSLNVSYHYNLGQLLSRMGDVDGAIGAYKRILKLDTSFLPAYQQLGQLCEIWLKESVPYRDSIWSQVLFYRPNDYVALYYHGMMMFRNNQPDSGIVCLKRAVEQDSLFYAAVYELALRNLARKNLDEAFSWYERALQLRPLNAKLFSEAGSFYEKAGRRENARACYRKAVSLDSMNATYAEQLGLINLALKMADSSIIYLKKAALLSKDNPNYFYNLAVAYEIAPSGSIDLAIQAFNDAIEACHLSDCANLYHQEAGFLRGRKKYAAAKKCYERAMQIDPANYDYILQCASIDREMGNMELAKKGYQKYLNITSSDSSKADIRKGVKDYLEYLESHNKQK